MTLGNGSVRRGSGYLIGPGRVLTAAHVIAGAAAVRVRFDADRPGARESAGEPAWVDERTDVAVLLVPGENRPPVRFGRLDGHELPYECRMVGFPWFKLREDPRDGSRYRDSCDAFGTLAPLSNRREGTLSIHVPPPDRDPDPEVSPWEGMSGAAVWIAGHVVGIVSRHHRSDGLGTLAAVSAERWAEGVDAARVPALEDLLGTSLRPGRLPSVRASSGPGRTPRLSPASARIVVATSDAAAPRSSAGWHGGAEVEVEGRRYLLHSEHLHDTFCAVRSVHSRRARGLSLIRGQERSTAGRYVWLHRVDAAADGSEARAALGELAAEYRLIDELGPLPGLPPSIAVTGGRGTSTLVLGWPPARPGGGPAETLAEAWGARSVPPDPWRTARLLTGLTGLCATLAPLHRRGIGHRRLATNVVITLDDGRLVLRDLGLAAREPRSGEAPDGPQAPEQSRRRSSGTPGPRTDVYRLAAIAYHLVTGRAPHPTAPIPGSNPRPDLPASLGRALRQGLETDPRSRPDIEEFAAALAAVRAELA
ncbi:trypsin-like peptidase domain-containing protein [Embleya sp. NPDC055612]